MQTKMTTGVGGRRCRAATGLGHVVASVPAAYIASLFSTTAGFQFALAAALVIVGTTLLVALGLGYPKVVEISRSTVRDRSGTSLEWKSIWAVHFVHSPTAVSFHKKHDTKPTLVAEKPFFSWSKRQRLDRLLLRMLKRANPEKSSG